MAGEAAPQECVDSMLTPETTLAHCEFYTYKPGYVLDFEIVDGRLIIVERNPTIPSEMSAVQVSPGATKTVPPTNNNMATPST